MAVEIERKFLIREGGREYATPAFRALYPSVDALVEDARQRGTLIRGGYLPRLEGQAVARALAVPEPADADVYRLRDHGGRFVFAIKGRGHLARTEAEAAVPAGLFSRYWPATAGRRVEKRRLEVPLGRWTAEFDVFAGHDLVLAEVEVSREEDLARLPVLGRDVSADPAYKNVALAR